MRSMTVSDRAVTIWFSGEEVPGDRALAALVRRALRERGMKLWRETEAERFDAGEETLVIARPGPARPQGFWFPGLDELLAGVMTCPEGPSALYRARNGYLLVLRPEDVRPGLYEFGEPVRVTSEWEAHAREQGQLLLREEAVNDLRRAFATEGPCYTDIC